MIRSIARAPVTVVVLPVRVVRRASQIRFSTILAVATGAAAAFTAARRLIDRDDAVEELPEGLQQPAARAQNFLVTSRGHLATAMKEADEEDASAREELHLDYLRRTGRLSD
jgi:hypothetical protein